VIHHDQQVAALRQVDDRVAEPAVAGVADRSFAGVEPEGEAFELRLRMARVPVPSSVMAIGVITGLTAA
jgi:hypothetical protein